MTTRQHAAMVCIVFGSAFGLMSITAIAYDIGVIVGRVWP